MGGGVILPPLAGIGLIDGKSSFDMGIKNEEETCKQIIEIGRNNVYNTGNLLDYEYF